MMTLRCTRKLLERLDRSGDLGEAKPSSVPNPIPASILPGSILPTTSLPTTSFPTTSLGDWYATILFTRPSHLILAVNEKSRLCLLLPTRELSTLAPRFRTEAAELLRRIGASEEEVAREVREMSPLAFGPTKVLSETNTTTNATSAANAPVMTHVVNRSVLGSMNDFTRMVKVSLQLRAWALRDLSEQMCETPCGPLGMRSPIEVALEILKGY